MKAVSDWRTMGFQLTLSLILQRNYIKEMYQLLEMLQPGKELVTLHPLLELSWQMLTGEDIGQLLLFLQFTSLYVSSELDTPSPISQHSISLYLFAFSHYGTKPILMNWLTFSLDTSPQYIYIYIHI